MDSQDISHYDVTFPQVNGTKRTRSWLTFKDAIRYANDVWRDENERRRKLGRERITFSEIEVVARGNDSSPFA